MNINFVLRPILLTALFSMTRAAMPPVVYSQACPNITGQVLYLNSVLSPVYGVTVELRSSEGQVLATDITDYQGSFSFCHTEAGAYYLTFSPVQEPGGINAIDALLALQHFVGVLTLEGMLFTAGDVNANGYINSVDAFMILQRFASLIPVFQAGSWLFETVNFNLAAGESINLTVHTICYGDLDASFIPPSCTPMPAQAEAGPDQNLGNTSTTLDANTPAAGQGLWSILSGEGGTVDEPDNPNSLFTGSQGSSYTLVWTISTICASTSDTVVITFTDPGMGGPCPGLPDFSYEGQTYNTVQIGTQCWMKENLNVGVFQPNNVSLSDNGIVEKHCYFNDTALCSEYGGLYTWTEMMHYLDQEGAQGICPVGWHIPTDAEWCTLASFLDNTVNCGLLGYSGTDVGGKLKESGFQHWSDPNTGATNLSGFSALGAGYCGNQGQFAHLLTSTLMWTSSSFSANSGYYWSVGYNSSIINRSTNLKYGSFSIRCLRNECPDPPTPAEAGADQSVGTTSVTLDGNTPLSGTGVWSVLFGEGGYIEEPANPNSLFTGSQGTSYTLVWTISTICASTSDTVVITFTDPGMGGPCPGLPDFSYEGQTYNTVQIGTQCWMKENLNVGTMIPTATVASDNGIIEKYCYNNDPANCAVYGAYYLWNEAMQYTDVPGSQGICPPGWHLPSQQDWCTLLTLLDPTVDCMVNPGSFTGTDAGGKLKEYGETHWQTPNTGATNESGFTALGAGNRFYFGGSTGIHVGAYLWSSSKSEGGFPLYWQMTHTSAQIARQLTAAAFGYSVRCVKDN